MFAGICIAVFAGSFVGSAVFKMKYKSPAFRKFSVKWNDSVGTVQTDLACGDLPANRFDLYLPADKTKEAYGLVVYLHAGGFTSGDKSGDHEMLEWLCSRGYVAAGINYTLRTEENAWANVYTQSVEIRDSIPFVIEAAKQAGYEIDSMAISGGSAGHALAMIYAYRDADQAPVPVKLVFGAVGPSSYYPEDWGCFGFDQPGTGEAAAAMFTVMSGNTITSDMFGTAAYDEAVKQISPLLWVDENTVPSVMAYGRYDKVQAFPASIRLDAKLTACGVDHAYLVAEHSGHGLQNDKGIYLQYLEKTEEYLNKYLPVK